MPNAAAYRSGATAFRRAATAAGGAESSVWAIGEDHGIREDLGVLVDRTLAAIATTVTSVGRGCDSVADECVRRAGICDQYALDVEAWERRHNTWSQQRTAWLMSLDDPAQRIMGPGSPPIRPFPPFPWVEL